MPRRALLVLVLVTSACFPESARHRRYAKLGEGAAVLGGIALQYVARTSCMPRSQGTLVEDDCTNEDIELVGLGLIFAGVVGFAATMMTAPDEPGSEDTEVDPDRGQWAAPQTFCPAITAGNVLLAEAALVTYVRSIGAISKDTAIDALQAWLARQACIVVADLDEETGRFALHVAGRDARYQIDVATSPFIVILVDDDVDESTEDPIDEP